jgi:hypothetical protein
MSTWTALKRTIFIIPLIMTGLSGCQYPNPRTDVKCGDTLLKRVADGVLTLGVIEVYRATALDCPPSTTTLRRRAEELVEGGDAAEQFIVGATLRLRQEFELGDRLICLSAHQRYQSAQAFMALGDQHGLPMIEDDLVQAYKWYNLAFYSVEWRRSAYADKGRAELAAQMTPAQIAEAERLAAEWQPNLPS